MGTRSWLRAVLDSKEHLLKRYSLNITTTILCQSFLAEGLESNRGCAHGELFSINGELLERSRGEMPVDFPLPINGMVINSSVTIPNYAGFFSSMTDRYASSAFAKCPEN